MTIPTQLALYNQALRMVGEGKLATLTDNRPERRILDTVFDEDPIKQMLEEAQWTWATRALEWNFDASITAAFGYRFGFTKPANYVRTVAVCSDEFFRAPLYDHVDENNFWFADLQTLYIKYVSDADDFGRDFSLWTELFRNCVASKMAVELALGLTKSDSLQVNLQKRHLKFVKDAKSLDAMSKPTTFLPPGNWTRSRRVTARFFRGTFSNSR